MKYWVYINDKVVGPYEEGQLASLEGFSPDTLICADGGNQEWVKANSVFDFGATNTSAAPAAQEMPVQQATASTAAQATMDAAAVQVLIDKIDSLTKEIEGMKTKLDQTWQASAATQAAMEKIHAVPVQTVQTAPSTEEPVVEDALITNTQSLVNHAEQIVAQAGTEKEEKPLDFLNEIHIGDEAASATVEDKNGEEVVLRSALDSMYGAKQEPEEEKESTFQDLLSPAKATAVTAAAAAAGVALTAATLGGTEQEATAEPVAVEPEVTEPKATEPEVVAPEATEPEVAAPVTEEKREEIINEITAPAAEPKDALSQAIEEAQQAPASDVPTLENAELPQETAEKPSLELTEEPQLNLASIPEPTAESLSETQTAPEEQPAPAAQFGQEVPALGEEPEAHPIEAQKEITQTAQELVPGKKLESAEKKEDDDELISQADLEEAFTERTPAQDFPFSEIQEETSSAEGNSQQSEAQSLPSGEGFYNPNDMTEVQLKEGSTYLISDFIPSANTGNTVLDDKAGAAAAAATGAAALAAIAAATDKPADKLTTEATITGESIEEIVPGKDKDDITMSKVILENTIRTKRGASMDIKTVPMVKEPADSERLDLTDSDLDINAQHDLKAADFKQPGSSLTKVILGTLVALVFAALIYVGLAYLDIIPAQFNVLKKATATEPAQDEQLNEMLGTTDQQQAPQAEPEQLVQPDQMPSDVENALTAAPAMEENANPMDAILTEVKNFPMVNGQTLEQLINSRHPAAGGLIEWSITTAVEPDNYSVLVKIPPENPQSFRITYRFNYNTVTKALDPTISDSKNLLDSLKS
ncbi:MAG: hypothetical protein IKN49_03020 [Elusimicrobiaceae bacterium]|nr:hypothetical protein [Elusimicrobiaceae bacterium]